MKWIKKWSFLATLIITGAVMMTATDSWAAVGAPAREAGAFVQAFLERDEADEGQMDLAQGQGDVSGSNGGDGQPAGEGQQGESGSGSQPAGDGSQGEAGAGNGSQPAGEGQQGESGSGSQPAGDGQQGESESGSQPTGEGQQGESGSGSQPAGDGPQGEAGSGDQPTGDGTAGEAGTDSQQEMPQGDGSQEQPSAPSEVTFTTVEDDYFSDAVFIGDSRIMGMYEYGGLEDIATFYCSTGLQIYTMMDAKIVSVPEQKEKITVEQALSERQFGKVYMMVGINEMGRGTVEQFVEKYSEVVNRIKELQPNAVIYIQGIMRVTSKRSAKGDYIHNEGINARNEGISKLADNERVFYLDVNPLICDETGGMIPDYTTDGVHLKAVHMDIWKDFLKQHAVVLD